MSTDFAALTSALAAGLPDVRACLIVSRDGLTLGSYPGSEEARTLSVWDRLAGLGEVERGFAVVGDELWVFSLRGPYAALALAGASARAGVVLDRLEQMLLVAQEDRLRREGLRGTARNQQDAEPPRRSRLSLHRERRSAPKPRPEPLIIPEHELRPDDPSVEPAESAGTPSELESQESTHSSESAERYALEVDPIALAREFAGLIVDQDEE
jgi:hypothetical protein